MKCHVLVEFDISGAFALEMQLEKNAYTCDHVQHIVMHILIRIINNLLKGELVCSFSVL